MASIRLPSVEPDGRSWQDSADVAYFQDYWSENSSDCGQSQDRGACVPCCGVGPSSRVFRAPVAGPPPAVYIGTHTGQFHATAQGHASHYGAVVVPRAQVDASHLHSELSRPRSSVGLMAPDSQRSTIHLSAVAVAPTGGRVPSGSNPQTLRSRASLDTQAPHSPFASANSPLVTKNLVQSEAALPQGPAQPPLPNGGGAVSASTPGTEPDRPVTKQKPKGKKAREGVSRGKNGASKAKAEQRRVASDELKPTKQTRATKKPSGGSLRPSSGLELAEGKDKRGQVGHTLSGTGTVREVLTSLEDFKKSVQHGDVRSNSWTAAELVKAGGRPEFVPGTAQVHNHPVSPPFAAPACSSMPARDSPDWQILAAGSQQYSLRPSQRQQLWRSVKESVRASEQAHIELAHREGEGVILNKCPRQLLPHPPNPALCVNTERPSKKTIDVKFRLLPRLAEEPTPAETAGVFGVLLPRSRARSLSRAMPKSMFRSSRSMSLNSVAAAKSGLLDSDGKVRFRVFQVKRRGDDGSSLVAYKWLNEKRSPETSENGMPLCCDGQCGELSGSASSSSAESGDVPPETHASNEEGGMGAFMYHCAGAVASQVMGCADSERIGEQDQKEHSCLPAVEAPEWLSQGQAPQCGVCDCTAAEQVPHEQATADARYQLDGYEGGVGQYTQYGEDTLRTPVNSQWASLATTEGLQQEGSTYVGAEGWSHATNGGASAQGQLAARQSANKPRPENGSRGSRAPGNVASTAPRAVKSNARVGQTESRASRAVAGQGTSQQLPIRKDARAPASVKGKQAPETLGAQRPAVGTSKGVTSTGAPSQGASTQSPGRMIAFAPRSGGRLAASEQRTAVHGARAAVAASTSPLGTAGNPPQSPEPVVTVSEVCTVPALTNAADCSCSSWQYKPFSCCEKAKASASGSQVPSFACNETGTTSKEQQAYSPLRSSAALCAPQQVPPNSHVPITVTEYKAPVPAPPARTATSLAEAQVPGPEATQAVEASTAKDFSLKTWLGNVMWSACGQSDAAGKKVPDLCPESTCVAKPGEEEKRPVPSEEEHHKGDDEEQAEELSDVFRPHPVSSDDRQKGGNVPILFRVLKRRQDSRHKTATSEDSVYTASVGGKSATKSEDEVLSLLSAATFHRGKPEPVFRFRVIQAQQAKDRESRRLVAFRPPAHPHQPHAPSLSHAGNFNMGHSQNVDGDACMSCVLPGPCRSSSADSEDSIVTMKYEHRTTYVPLPTKGKTIHVVTHHGLQNIKPGVLGEERKMFDRRLLCVSSFAAKVARDAAERVAVRQAIREAKDTGPTDESEAEPHATEEPVRTEREEEEEQEEVTPECEGEWPEWAGSWKSISGAAELFCCPASCRSQPASIPSTQREIQVAVVQEGHAETEEALEEGKEESEEVVEEGGAEAAETREEEPEEVVEEAKEELEETTEQQEQLEAGDAECWKVPSPLPETLQRGSCGSCFQMCMQLLDLLKIPGPKGKRLRGHDPPSDPGVAIDEFSVGARYGYGI
ncbi:conserved hypothetical protein [Neospora caninum Liverpool]|uniref:Uncharacterized protein n=1 Tax=Neospora caninum (strain Liverpool) TaxID=572307 RepID=F0VM01_NEOCL|nr:conserved hypothetical protein [Neospora caninum Liverpool]CBZ54279.1 conserved hypothetical protein [Neospora caninum Liverpool]|eukprot:XP_003884310.1 conserved hypothetical protein [Neospora caninum Liverpool]